MSTDFATICKNANYLRIADVFNALRNDLFSVLHNAKPLLVKKARIRTYAAAIRHLRLLHPYESTSKSTIKTLLSYYQTREDYGEQDEEFFEKYAPKNSVLKGLAKICRMELETVPKEQIEKFMDLASFHLSNYLSRYID